MTPTAVAVQITSVDQVPKAETSAEHARSSGAATHGEHRQSSLDQHTSAAETICGQPATAATVFAAPGVAKQRSHDSQKATCKPSHSATGLLHQNGRGHIRGRPSSSQRGPVGLGSATPFKERATPSMLKRKAKAAPLDVRIGSVKKLKTCHDVIDLTSDFDTLVSAQPSQAIRTVPLQIDWHGTKTSGNKHEAVRVDAMQFGMSTQTYPCRLHCLACCCWQCFCSLLNMADVDQLLPTDCKLLTVLQFPMLPDVYVHVCMLVSLRFFVYGMTQRNTEHREQYRLFTPVHLADALHDDAGIDKEDTVSSQQLTELTNDRQVMQKWLMDQLQRLKQHDIRCVVLLTVKICTLTASPAHMH